MAAYRYNARDDDLAAWNKGFTSRIGDGLGDPEEEYLSTLRLVVGCRPRARLVDIGCGLGRVVGLVHEDVESIVGLEPDPERFADCHAAFHDGNRIEILNSTSGRYKADHPGKTFDVAVVSMVIQHVSTQICDGILADLHDLLRDDGVGVIATTQQEVERFTLQKDATPLSAAAFDRYAEDSAGQDKGIPVRQFSRHSFLAALDRAGLELIRWGQFSYIRPDRVGWFAKWFGTKPDAICDVGTSQYAVVKKRARA